MRTKNGKSKLLVKALAVCATLCTAFGMGFTVTNFDKANVSVSADVAENRINYNDWLGLEDRTSWASGGHADIVTLGLMDFSITEGNQYFKSSVNGCWYRGNNDVITTNNGLDILQYVYLNGVSARDLLLENKENGKVTQGTTNWLSNSAAWPIAFETGTDCWIRIDQSKFDGEFTFTFKPGFELTRSDGVRIYLSKDVVYQYKNGTLVRVETHTVSFEGLEESKTLLAGEKIKDLPAVPAQDGKVGLWKLNGKILNEGDILTSSGKATPVYAIEYKDLLGVEDRTSWGAHEGEYYLGGVTLDPFEYLNTSVNGTWYVGNDDIITANNGVDIMQYIYINGKSARALITANANGDKLVNGCNCWLSNPAACPVYVETTSESGIIIRLLKSFVGESFTITFKAGFSLIRNDGEVIYLSEDVHYVYANGALPKGYALTFEGTDTEKIVANGCAIGALPEISEQEGVHTEWQIDGAVITAETVYNFTENKTATAVFYALATVDGVAKRVNLGTKLEKPADPTKEETASHTYAFDGWYIKGTDTKWDFENDVVNADVEIEARFIETEKEKFTVVFNADNGTQNTSVEVYVGACAVAPEATPEKTEGEIVYSFLYWSLDGETEYDFATPVTESITLTALYTLKKHTVIIGGVEQEVVDGQKLTAPQDPTKEATAEYTYTFEGWYNGETKWDFEKDVVTSDIELVAKFTQAKRSYTLTFNVTGNDAVTIDSVTVEYGTFINFADLLAGKNIKGYEYSFTVNGKVVIGLEVEADATVNVTFTKKESSNSGCGGAIGSTAGVLLGMAALGVAFLVGKKKED